MAICRACGNTGFTKDNPNECPECGKKRVTLSNIHSVPMEDKKNIDYTSLIPVGYKDKHFTGKVLSTKYADNAVFDKYCNNLQYLVDNLVKGELPRISVMFYAPPGHAKHTWAYTMIKVALENGMSALPLLDFNDIQNVIEKNTDEKANAYLRGITEYDLYTADVCIVNINGYTLKNGRMMLHLMDKRCNFNKVTFFISTETKSKVLAFIPEITNLFTPHGNNGRHLYYLSYS